LLPGFEILGLRGWDDFIVRNVQDQAYSVPTLPLDPRYLTPFSSLDLKAVLRPDERFTAKMKWYVKPILFGGHPDAAENLSWINHEEHAQLVKWWNNLYRDLKAPPGRG
jgi:hypothetical protein